MFCRAASYAAPAGAASTARAMTPPSRGLSSPSSSSKDRREFCGLVRGANEARQRYSNATRKVSQLEHSLEAVQVALEASERETTVAQAAATDAQSCVVGKDVSMSCHLTRHLSFLISF